MIKSIPYQRYINLFNLAKNLNPRTALNLDNPLEEADTLYLESSEGISYLQANGKLGGLARYKEGNERIAEIHQDLRIKLGGHFLDCYVGKLSRIYAAQGFKIVARLKFNPEFAPEGWEKDADLAKRPDIVFMSLKPVREILSSNDYEACNNYARIDVQHVCRKHHQGIDRSNLRRFGAKMALDTMGHRNVSEITNIVSWHDFHDIYFKAKNATDVSNKDYLRVITKF